MKQKLDKISNNDIKAVVFDIDGTLYSNMCMFVSAPHIYIRNIYWLVHFAYMRKKLRASIKPDNAVLHKGLKEIFDKNSIRYFSERVGVPNKEADVLLHKHIYAAWIHGISKVPLRLGMRVLLGNLKRNGYRLAILSDFQSQKKIENWNLVKYFDEIICAEDYGVLKPDKRIFNLLHEKINCKPNEIIFVGNHLKYDGIGALDAGFHSFLFYNKFWKIKKIPKNITWFSTMCGLKKNLIRHGIELGTLYLC